MSPRKTRLGMKSGNRESDLNIAIKGQKVEMANQDGVSLNWNQGGSAHGQTQYSGPLTKSIEDRPSAATDPAA